MTIEHLLTVPMHPGTPGKLLTNFMHCRGGSIAYLLALKRCRSSLFMTFWEGFSSTKDVFHCSLQFQLQCSLCPMSCWSITSKSHEPFWETTPTSWRYIPEEPAAVLSHSTVFYSSYFSPSEVALLDLQSNSKIAALLPYFVYVISGVRLVCD